jgi:hypothetical protein
MMLSAFDCWQLKEGGGAGGALRNGSARAWVFPKLPQMPRYKGGSRQPEPRPSQRRASVDVDVDGGFENMHVH